MVCRGSKAQLEVRETEIPAQTYDNFLTLCRRQHLNRFLRGRCGPSLQPHNFTVLLVDHLYIWSGLEADLKLLVFLRQREMKNQFETKNARSNFLQRLSFGGACFCSLAVLGKYNFQIVSLTVLCIFQTIRTNNCQNCSVLSFHRKKTVQTTSYDFFFVNIWPKEARVMLSQGQTRPGFAANASCNRRLKGLQNKVLLH